MYDNRDNIDPWYRRRIGTSSIGIVSSTSDVQVQVKDVVSFPGLRC